MVESVLQLLGACSPHDVRIEIEEALTESSETAAVEIGAQRGRWRKAIPWSLAGLMTAMAGAASWKLMGGVPQAPRPVTRSIIPLEQPLAVGTGHPTLALSPDGTRLVFVAERGGTTQLYLRARDELEARPIAATEGASGPFFSPDGQSVGFVAGNRLKSVSLLGGAPVTLGNVPSVTQGASWGPGNDIVITMSINGGVERVSPSGRTALTVPDSEKRVKAATGGRNSCRGVERCSSRSIPVKVSTMRASRSYLWRAASGASWPKVEAILITRPRVTWCLPGGEHWLRRPLMWPV
ncbi:MAG: TolB family protein [Acidobacteriota bacterium]